MKHVRSPRVMLTLSMVIFGTIPLFVRAIPLTSAQLALCRAGLAALLLGGYLLISGQGIPLKTIRRELPLLLLSGVAMGFNWILLFEAYKYTTVSVATLSYYFAPVLVTMLCPLLFHEKLTRRQVLCFVMSTLGLILVTGLGELSGGSELEDLSTNGAERVKNGTFYLPEGPGLGVDVDEDKLNFYTRQSWVVDENSRVLE